MAKMDQIRTKLQNKLFSAQAGLAQSVTLKSKGTPVYNDRGEILKDNYTSSTISIITYNQVLDRSFEQFGKLNIGELEAAVPYNITINVEDLVTLTDGDYIVTGVSPNPLPQNVVTICRLKKVLA